MADYEFKVMNQIELVNRMSPLAVSFFVGAEPIIITEKDILVKNPSCFDRNRASLSNNRFKKPIRGNLKNIRDNIV